MVKTTILALPGTGAPHGGDGITEDFLSHFDTDLYHTKVVPYTASYGGTSPSFTESRRVGRVALLDAIDSLSGDPCVIAGYSQGAVIAGDLAAELGSQICLSQVRNIKACALIADGSRPRGLGVPATRDVSTQLAGGYGILGERPVPTRHFPTFWVSNPGDPICALPAGNPLRSVADLTGYFSIRSPQDVLLWGAKMIDTVTRRQMEQWWNPVNRSSWGMALAYTRGFVFDGRHTTDYITRGYTEALSIAVDRVVNKD